MVVLTSSSRFAHFSAWFILALGLSAVSGVANAAPPVISGTPPGTTTAKSPYAFSPTASDADGDTLMFSIANKPWWAYFNTSTGHISGTPPNPGKWSNIAISVSDGKSTVSLPAFSLTVVANRAPVISGSPPTSATANKSYSFRPTVSDADGDAVTFTIANKPSWASFSSSTGSLSGTPTAAGTASNIVITATDGKLSASLPAFTVTVVATNKAPTITGTPLTALNANTAYTFKPTASDADGDALTFSIANKPAWASFSASTGQLSGTPAAADVGGYANIVISVSDGKATTSLTAFAIAVNQVSLGAATLLWTSPNQNTDGSALTNLAGFRIVYGTSATALTQTVEIANPSISSYVIEGLAPATYYFAVRAYASGGAESANSNVASKVVK